MEKKKTIERSVEIAVPAAAVFAFLADIRNMAKWLVAIKKIWDTSHDDPGLGLTYRWQYGFLGVTLVGTGECVVHESPRRVTFRTAGDSEGDWAFVLEEREGKTHLTLTVTYTLPDSVFGRIKNAAREMIANHDADRAVEDIKVLCEAEIE